MPTDWIAGWVVMCILIHVGGGRLLWNEVFEMHIPYKNPKKWPPLGFSNEYFFLPWHNSPSGPSPSHYQGFKIPLRHTTLGRTPLNEWSARHRNLYPTTHNTHNRQISMPSAWFEPQIPASERPETHSLDRATTWDLVTSIGLYSKYIHISVGIVMF